MSNLVFPNLTSPQGGVTKGFPFKKWPEFNTLLDTPGSNRGEFTTSLTPYPIWNFELDVPYLSGNLNDPNSALAQAVGFWTAMRGKYDTFLFNDLSDNIITQATQFGVGDGSTTAFWLSRQIGNLGVDAIQNLNGNPKIYINNVLKTITTDYTISSTGVVTFTSAPAANAILTWTGSFYFRCRFKDDALQDLQMDAPGIWSCKTFSFHTVIL